MNLLEDLTPDQLAAHGLAWDHPPLGWKRLPEGGIRVAVPPKVDYFQAPTGTHAADNAPYLWLNATGDFVAQAHVRPAFTTQWDAGAVMVRHDALHWAKLCYERTDFGTTATVSVVTREQSDDANGVDLVAPDLWLQIFRAANVFGMHYALEGTHNDLRTSHLLGRARQGRGPAQPLSHTDPRHLLQTRHAGGRLLDA